VPDATASGELSARPQKASHTSPSLTRVTRALAVSLSLLLLSACGHSVLLVRQAPATLPSEPPGYENATVTRVIDGDTIEVAITDRFEGPGAGRARVGATYDVRLLGIDTPESVDPRSPVECFGPEASAAAKALLLGKSVTLVKDTEESDQYGRLLRYVYLGDEMADARLVANGYAHAYPYPPNTRHSGLLVQLEREAREADRGLWSADTCSGKN
jgi:micrococcal nuclease